VNTGNPSRARDLGHILGTYFAWTCAQSGKERLTELLKAKGDFILVASAVTLKFEDRVDGMSHLKQFATLPKDPGSRAALVFCRMS
jgi:hypothetical protein